MAADDFVALHPNYLKASQIVRASFAGVVAVAAIVVFVMADVGWTPLVVGAIVLGFVAVLAVLAVIEVRHLAYLVREHDITFRRGVIFRNESTLPFVRIQHCSVNQGPYERRFGLSTVSINAAGSSLTIPGLATADAERLKSIVIARAGELLADDS